MMVVQRHGEGPLRARQPAGSPSSQMSMHAPEGPLGSSFPSFHISLSKLKAKGFVKKEKVTKSQCFTLGLSGGALDDYIY